uniref:Uncharacterized protein n=1 Tax=candidate division WOR-3 bacterium TaxID=2052148 RepID=A0A7V4E2V8_UNCW3
MKKILFLAFLIIFSCSLFKKEKEEVMPLAVDNFWVYQYLEEKTFKKGSSLPRYFLRSLSNLSQSEIDTLKLVAKESIEGVDGYVGFSTLEEDTLGIFYYQNDYLWLYSYDEELSMKLFPQKPNIGDKWISYEDKRKTTDFDGDGKEDSINFIYEDSIIGKEEVSVPVGNFKDCYRVEEKEIYKRWYSTNGQWKIEATEVFRYSWVKMGIGFVKIEIPEEGTYELIVYQIK